MSRERLTPESVVTFAGHTYNHRQFWALVRAIQCAGLRVSFRCLEAYPGGYLAYEAYVWRKEPGKGAVSGEHGSAFLAVRAALQEFMA